MNDLDLLLANIERADSGCWLWTATRDPLGYGQTSILGPNATRARWAAQKQCKRGHEFTDANTYMFNGARHCRACARARSLAHYHATKQLKGAAA